MKTSTLVPLHVRNFLEVEMAAESTTELIGQLQRILWSKGKEGVIKMILDELTLDETLSRASSYGYDFDSEAAQRAMESCPKR